MGKINNFTFCQHISIYKSFSKKGYENYLVRKKCPDILKHK